MLLSGLFSVACILIQCGTTCPGNGVIVINQQSRPLPTDMTASQTDLGNLSVETLSFQVTFGCIKMEIQAGLRIQFHVFTFPFVEWSQKMWISCAVHVVLSLDSVSLAELPESSLFIHSGDFICAANSLIDLSGQGAPENLHFAIPSCLLFSL